MFHLKGKENVSAASYLHSPAEFKTFDGFQPPTLWLDTPHPRSVSHGPSLSKVTHTAALSAHTVLSVQNAILNTQISGDRELD